MKLFKIFKGIGITLLFLPFLAIAGIIIFEIIGMCANHVTTDRQTDKLQTDLTEKIPDIEIVHVSSETGNASGTGNHVECMSTIIFSTEMTEDEIKAALSEYYTSDNQYCTIKKEDGNSYSVYLESAAPFPNNIEGH